MSATFIPPRARSTAAQGAADLLGHPGLDDLLAREQVLDQADVGAVADDHLGVGDRRQGRRRGVLLGAGPDPDDVEDPHRVQPRDTSASTGTLTSLGANATRATARVIEPPAPSSV